MQYKLYTKKEICEWLGVSRATIDRWREKGMPSIKGDRAVRFDKNKITEWMERNDK
jgi:excisionase family DNA binding protein